MLESQKLVAAVCSVVYINLMSLWTQASRLQEKLHQDPVIFHHKITRFRVSSVCPKIQTTNIQQATNKKEHDFCHQLTVSANVSKDVEVHMF